MIQRLIPACLFFLSFGLVASLAEKQLAGGWGKADVAAKEVTAAADFALKAQQNATPAPKEGAAPKLELVKIEEAEQQVVAGMNFRLKLKVKVDGKEKTAKAVVWWQAWRKPEPYQLTSWEWVEK